ncbi:hypothetical protein KBD87_04060 [Candidatus Saccharibacteria bacterium]|mgnify:CR=1 FL=1|nr:hypothetical protein [Candidatus Saccharibacteria bacterium]
MEPGLQPTETQPDSVVSQAAQPQAVMSEDQTIQWQSPEYVSSVRTPMWYLVFWATVVVVMILAGFFMKSWSFVLLIPVMAFALTIYTHRPAHMMQYVVSPKGLYINEQVHVFDEFKSFSVLQDEALPTLVLTPVRRFRPAVTVHFPDEVGEQLVDFMGTQLPMEDARTDVFDTLVKKLRL